MKRSALSNTATVTLIAFAAICLIQTTAGGATKPKPKQPAGGANQVSGANGKIGQMLFTGYWRFEALAFHPNLTSYTLKFPMAEEDFGVFRDVATFDTSDAPKTFKPKDGYVLAAVDCLLKNGQNNTFECDCSTPEDAVTDDQGQSYTAIGFDMLTDGPASTKLMLPGSAEKMTIIFAVPPGTNIKDLVFIPFNRGPGGGNTKRTLRISLATPTTPSH